MSSMSVYGNITAEVVNELTQPNDPNSYGQSRLAGELLLSQWVQKTKRTEISIRLPGIVGYHSHDNFLSDSLHAILTDMFVKASNPEAFFNNVVFVGEWACTPRTVPVKSRELT